jgi:hypothetical protein
MRRATTTAHAAGIARFLFFEVRALAEDKRFELLRVSPTRFPSVRPRPLGESSAGQLTGYRDPCRTLFVAAGGKRGSAANEPRAGVRSTAEAG